LIWMQSVIGPMQVCFLAGKGRLAEVLLMLFSAKQIISFVIAWRRYVLPASGAAVDAG